MTTVAKNQFYSFRQNNSGGSFSEPAITVIVEAQSVDEASDRAISAGLYFNGVREGWDCECCGDRWYAPWSDESGDDLPSEYGKPIVDDVRRVLDGVGNDRWARDDVPSFKVYYLDGQVLTIP